MRRPRSWPPCARCSLRTSSSRATRQRSSIAVVQKTLRLCRRVFFALLVPCAAAGAADDPAYLRELVERSRELRLAERPEWRKLLHYEPDLVGPGLHGLLDSPAFYNSPRGKTDPRAELEATLAAFFSDEQKQCAFTGRRAWLDEELQFDPHRLPRAACPRYEEWHAALNAHHLTLVFASAYINNPSSMYGHTLLRIDARDQDERTRLLGYAVNSAAVAGEETGSVAFAVKGLLGGYPGTFSILPYYVKVREYSDLENRDLWEYEIALAPHEMERVLRHLWEVLPAYYDYYFFDENCSYHLLGLLQVARPELELTAPFRWWALPSDTVRVLTQTPGLVARTVYRPANATLIGARRDTMSKEERSIAKDLSHARAGGRDAARALPSAREAAVLEAAHDYLNYRRATGTNQVPDAARLARELLVERSALDVPSQMPAIPVPARPDHGHGTKRMLLGGGKRDSRDFQELRLRASYHDLLDAQAGYPRGAQIQFGDTALRHYQDGGVRLEHFVPFDVVSLAPRDDFFDPLSWQGSIGWRRMFLRNGSDPLMTTATGGAGGTWATERMLFYAMADASFRAHHDLERGFGLGAGARAGALLDPSPAWRVHAYVRGLGYFLGESDQPRALGLDQRFSLGRDSALRLDLSRNRESGRDYGAGSLSLMLYF
jgi:hypothetical protein